MTFRMDAIVLAAGQSTRMGKDNKLLLHWQQRPLVEHVVRTLTQRPQLTRVHVVLGHDGAKIMRCLSAYDVTFHQVEETQAGMSASLKLGAQVVRDIADAAMICLGDMPLVSGALIDALCTLHQSNTAHATVPTFHGRWGHPVIFPTSQLMLFDTLEGDQGARAILNANPVNHLLWSDETIFMDVDTPDDFTMLCQI